MKLVESALFGSANLELPLLGPVANDSKAVHANPVNSTSAPGQARYCFGPRGEGRFESRSRLRLSGIARKLALPVATPCGRNEVDTLLYPPKVPHNQRKRPEAAISIDGDDVS